MESWPNQNPQAEGFFRRWQNARRIGKIAKVLEAVAETAPSKPPARDISHIALRPAGNH